MTTAPPDSTLFDPMWRDGLARPLPRRWWTRPEARSALRADLAAMIQSALGELLRRAGAKERAVLRVIVEDGPCWHCGSLRSQEGLLARDGGGAFSSGPADVVSDLLDDMLSALGPRPATPFGTPDVDGACPGEAGDRTPAEIAEGALFGVVLAHQRRALVDGFVRLVGGEGHEARRSTPVPGYGGATTGGAFVSLSWPDGGRPGVTTAEGTLAVLLEGLRRHEAEGQPAGVDGPVARQRERLRGWLLSVLWSLLPGVTSSVPAGVIAWIEPSLAERLEGPVGQQGRQQDLGWQIAEPALAAAESALARIPPRETPRQREQRWRRGLDAAWEAARTAGLALQTSDAMAARVTLARDLQARYAGWLRETRPDVCCAGLVTARLISELAALLAGAAAAPKVVAHTATLVLPAWDQYLRETSGLATLPAAAMEGLRAWTTPDVRLAWYDSVAPIVASEGAALRATRDHRDDASARPATSAGAAAAVEERATAPSPERSTTTVEPVAPLVRDGEAADRHAPPTAPARATLVHPASLGNGPVRDRWRDRWRDGRTTAGRRRRAPWRRGSSSPARSPRCGRSSTRRCRARRSGNARGSTA